MMSCTVSLTLTQYPLMSRYTTHLCVTSSFQLFPPFTTILTSFNLEVPVLHHLWWCLTKTSLGDHNFYILLLTLPFILLHMPEPKQSVTTLNPGISVSINLGGNLCWHIALSWYCTSIWALLFHYTPNISYLLAWGPNILMNRASTLWHSCYTFDHVCLKRSLNNYARARITVF